MKQKKIALQEKNNLEAMGQPRYTGDHVRKDFPILAARIHDKPLAYLDNAATTQKPQCVIDAITRYYAAENANIHRGIHTLSEISTEKYETVRRGVCAFLGADARYEAVFVRGATEAINLVAHGLQRVRVKAGDEILVTGMEHHANIVPWQLLCEAANATLRVVPLNEAGELNLDEFERLLNERTAVVAVTHVSNVLGTINPVHDICAKARAQGAVSLIDGAQSAPHAPIDVATMGADFFVCSGHKMYGPTGIGIVCGNKEWLERMPPYQGGGGAIQSVTFEKTTFADAPHRFEAGTPHIAGVIGLGAALTYLSSIGMDAIVAHEQEVLTSATDALSEIEGLTIIGNALKKAAILSFTMDGIHPHDIAQLLNNEGIAIRAGHHCAQPLMTSYGIHATARVSFAAYNTADEIDVLTSALRAVREVFA